MTAVDDGAVIRAMRRARGVTQQGLAEAIGISKSYLCHIEAGRRTPKGDVLQRIREHLQPDGHPRFRISFESRRNLAAPFGVVRTVDIAARNLRDALCAAAELPAASWSEAAA